MINASVATIAKHSPFKRNMVGASPTGSIKFKWGIIYLHKSTGILKYYPNKLIVEIDQEISNYYRKLIPKWIKTNKQMYQAHISVVRNEIPPNMQYWDKYEGNEIEFYYENIVRFGTVYCWLNVFSTRLEEIRIELGLPVSSMYTLPPEGFTKCFHATLGNFKGLTDLS